jgi:FkbM family methyltransferase
MKHFIFRIIISIWRIAPFKRKLSGLINKNTSLKKKLYKDLRFEGEMRVNVRGKDMKLYNPGFTTIENEIFWNGINHGWEKVSINLWMDLATHAKVILDIGANSGIYTFISHTINPEATIYAFEPVKRTAVLFKKNLELNQSSNIHFIEKAVSNENGMATFYDVPAESQYSASLNEEMLKDINETISYPVEIIKLDEFEELKDKKIDLIKLDVEMHEPEALEGMIKMIKRDKPSFLIEILTDEIADKIESIIGDLNYLYFSIDEINQPKKVDHLRKSEHYNFLLIQEEVFARYIKF